MDQLKTPVEEFTTPNPITAREESGMDELERLFQENGIRHLPIIKDQQVVGVVSERDLRLVAGLDLRERCMVRAADIMSRNPVTVNHLDPLDEVAFKMSEKKIGSVIVNEDDSFLGIFTLTDALNALIEITRSETRR